MALNLGGAINKRKLTNIQNISTEFGSTIIRHYRIDY